MLPMAAVLGIPGTAAPGRDETTAPIDTTLKPPTITIRFALVSSPSAAARLYGVKQLGRWHWPADHYRLVITVGRTPGPVGDRRWAGPRSLASTRDRSPTPRCSSRRGEPADRRATMTRQLHVSPEVAQAMPAAYLAQLQAVVDAPDNRCARCQQPITSTTVEAVILRDENSFTVRLAHPDCARSGIYPAPGMNAAITARITDPDGVDINTTLGRRPNPSPRALVFLEPVMLVSVAPPGDTFSDSDDPLGVYAVQRGLKPITGRLDQITPRSDDHQPPARPRRRARPDQPLRPGHHPRRP